MNFFSFFKKWFLSLPKLDSESFHLNTADVKRLLRNGLIVGFVSFLCYIAQNISSVDMGGKGILIIPFLSIGLDALVKWLRDNVNTDMDEDEEDWENEEEEDNYRPRPKPDRRKPR